MMPVDSALMEAAVGAYKGQKGIPQKRRKTMRGVAAEIGIPQSTMSECH